MKNYLSVFAILLCCYCISSCNTATQGGLSATAQKNLDAMHGVTQAFDSKDFSKLGDFIADDAVDHAASDSGDVKGLANIKASFEKYGASITGQKTEVIKELADDEYVMSWAHYTGSNKAGDKIDMKALEVAKFKDGKAVEHWTFMEPGDVMKMMSAQQSKMPPPPAPTVKKDSTKK